VLDGALFAVGEFDLDLLALDVIRWCLTYFARLGQGWRNLRWKRIYLVEDKLLDEGSWKITHGMALLFAATEEIAAHGRISRGKRLLSP
jgi:hypothetical protein